MCKWGNIPDTDQVVQDIMDYVLNYNITSELMYETARLCLINVIGLNGIVFHSCF